MGSYFSISISATENSYNIENNTSNVTVSLWCNGNNGWADDNPSYWLKVNGNEVASGTKNFSYTSFTVCSWTGNVAHNADGTGSITYQGYYQGTDKPNGDTTAVYTLNLTTIPRASEILNGTTQRAIDGTISFSVDKKSANFVDKLTIYPTSNTSLTTVVSPYTTGSTFTIGTVTFNSIKALAPTTSYTSMVVQVETFTSSGVIVGTASSQFRGSFSVTAPTISPTWSASPTNGIVTGHDGVRISLGKSATPDIGTTISAYEFSVGNSTYITTTYSAYFNSVETNNVSVKIIDNRNLSTTVSTNNLFGIIQYEKPIINASINRSPSLIDTGAILVYDGTYTYIDADVDSEAGLEASYKVNNGSWTTISSGFSWGSGNFSGTFTFASGTFDAAQEYSVYLRIHDVYVDEYSEKQLILSKAAVTFDMDLTNQRVGIGQPVPVATSGSGGLVSGGLVVSGKIKEEGQYLEDKYGGINQQQLLNLIYPVGSIYMSTANVSPATFLGGTWTQIKDTFLLSAGQTYSAGATGGEATHTLTTDEIPSHNHSLNRNIPYGFAVMTTSGVRVGGGPNYYITEDYNPYSVNNAGGDQPHNNMPPYLVVYMWKRTA